MNQNDKNISIASELLASASVLEVLPTVQQKVEFADRAIKTVIGLTNSGFCLKGYIPSSPIDAICSSCKVKDEAAIDDKPFDCPLHNNVNYRLIPLSTTETFFGNFLVYGESINQIFLYDHHILNFLTILSVSIDDLIKSLALGKLNSTLRESEEKYRNIFVNTQVVIYQTSLEGRLISVNPALVKIAGYDSPEEMMTEITNIGEQLYADRLQRIKHTQLLAEYGKVDGFEIQLKRKDGQTFWVLSSSIAVKDSEGNILYYEGTFFDITKRKQAEEALKESEERYRTITTNLPSIVMIHKDNKIAYLNQNGIDLLGYSWDEIRDHSVFDFLQDESKKLVSENMQRRLSGEIIEDYEVGILTKNNTKKALLIRAIPIVYGNEIVLLVVLIDITERKQAEEALRESESSLRNAQEIAQMGSWEWDMITQKANWSDNYCAILGIEPNKVEPRFELFRNRIHPDDIHLLDENYATIIKDKTSSRFELRLIQPDGTVKWIQNNISPINKDGKLVALKGVIIDISERKQVEEEIKIKNEELIKMNAEKDKFFSIIAHDLRSPFNSFLGLTQIMAEELPNLTMDEIQKIAVSMKNSATNLFSLLENLLEWSSIKQGLIPFNPEVIQLLPVAYESIAMIAEPAKIKDIEVSFNIPDNLEVFADNNILQTIIRNLFSNAVKFTPRGGKISLSAKTSGNKSVEISLKDSGIGMSSTLVDNLFRFDVQTNREGTEGEPSTGLGLIICKDFIEKQGGKLWVESEEGKGSTFYFTVPIGE